METVSVIPYSLLGIFISFFLSIQLFFFLTKFFKVPWSIKNNDGKLVVVSMEDMQIFFLIRRAVFSGLILMVFYVLATLAQEGEDAKAMIIIPSLVSLGTTAIVLLFATFNKRFFVYLCRIV